MTTAEIIRNMIAHSMERFVKCNFFFVDGGRKSPRGRLEAVFGGGPYKSSPRPAPGLGV